MNFMKSLAKTILASDGSSITVQEAKQQLDNKSAPLLLDVRTPDEYRAGHAKQATSIPLDQLTNRLDELPKDRDILCICRSGGRSGRATGQLRKAGYQAINISGGMMAWQRAGFSVKRGK